MAGFDFEENKSEAPTPRRREKAREEGQVVYSPDLNGAVTLLLIAVGALWVAPSMTAQLQTALRTRILGLDGSEWGPSETAHAVNWLVDNLWGIAGGVAITFLGISLLMSQVQTGFLISGNPLFPNWGKLSPVEGFQRLFSMESVTRGLLSILKLCSLIAVAGAVMYVWQQTLAMQTHGTLSQSVEVGWEFVSQLLLWLAGSTFVWGAADYGFRWFRMEQKLRMSREEIIDEHKEEQGDPHVRAKVRRLQKEAAQRKTLKDVPRATVVLTNPTHFAVALRYESGVMKAPKVVAKGSDAFARRIVQIARQHGVPVLERKPLARALYAMANVGKDIPLEFYRAVAEILAQVYRLKNAK